MYNNFEDDMIISNNVDKHILKSKALREFIQFRLNKMELEEKDLIGIDDIFLDGITIAGDINIINWDDLNYFPNLKKIELKNLIISKQHIKKLELLDEISFKNCEIESLKELKQIKKISINNSNIEDITQIGNLQNLEELEIINTELLDFNFLKHLKNLKTLKIKNVRDFSLNEINFFLPITYLSIDEIYNLDMDTFFKNYPNLKIFSVKLEKQEKCQEHLNKLSQKGIKVLLSDIYEY